MNLLYYDNKYLKECLATVEDIFEENGKNYLRLNNNIFYAQGGGQKGDKGAIIYDNQEYQVINCIKDEKGYPIIITDTLLPQDSIQKEVMCRLDWNFRYTQMKLHTSLHLLHCFICEYYNKEIEYPISSNIEKDFAYNKYPQELITDDVIEFIRTKFDEFFKQDIDVVTYADEKNPMYRYWQCMDFIIPCGGVHVSKLNEIGKISINYHNKKGITTIKITL